MHKIQIGIYMKPHKKYFVHVVESIFFDFGLVWFGLVYASCDDVGALFFNVCEIVDACLTIYC